MRETIFSTDHRLQLAFSSSLANMFAAPTRSDEEAQLPSARYSGLVLRARCGIFRRGRCMRYGARVGSVTLMLALVQENHFRRNLMGRYFRGVTAKQLTRYVGRQPHELTVKETAPARLEVDDRAWQEFAAGNAALLAQARIVFVFPASEHN